MILWLLGCDVDVAGRSLTLATLDAVDGSSTGIQMPHCGCYSGTANVSLWHKADIPAYVGLCPLSGVKRTFHGAQ